MTDPTPRQDQRLRTASLAGAVIAAIAASACCVVPATLAIFGASGVGLAAAFEPYRPLLLGVTAALLALAFYLSYRKPKAVAASAPADECGCAPARAPRKGRVMLWSATGLAVVLAAYPYLAAPAGANGRGTSAASERATSTAVLRIGGMSCAACVAHINEALAKVDGIVAMHVSYAPAIATITYDPSKTSSAAAVAAIEAAGYSVSLTP